MADGGLARSADAADSGALARYLEVTCREVPVIGNTIAAAGESRLLDHVQSVVDNSAPAYQSLAALLHVIREYTAPLLGEEAAERAATSIAHNPVALTANHHGVDYFAQSVQGSLILSLHRACRGAFGYTVPVFACGNVPLNNLTYPRGMLVYAPEAADPTRVPQRLPIFSDRFKRRMVSLVGGLDEDVVKRAITRAETLARRSRLPRPLAEALLDVLREDYCAPEVLAQPSYSAQAVILNARIWRRMFARDAAPAALAYLEIEKLTSMLLERDLRQAESLASLVLFDRPLRERLLANLDGNRACWNQAALMRRLLGGDDRAAPAACGTVFFWGIDDAGTRVPLLIERRRGVEFLVGADDKGREWRRPFDATAVTEGLHDRQLLPSLFTTFLVLSFARGVTCLGGYYQAEYLVAMKDGLVRALAALADYEAIAAVVARAPADRYLSGMQAVMRPWGEAGLIPAGPLEIIAAGGLCAADLRRIHDITVRDAHMASLFETLPDVAPAIAAGTGWQELARECHRWLGTRILVK